MEKIRRVADPAKIDYVVVNHVEPDHAGALPEVLKAAPNAKFVITMQGKTRLCAITATALTLWLLRKAIK